MCVGQHEQVFGAKPGSHIARALVMVGVLCGAAMRLPGQDMTLNDVLLPNESWQLVAEGFRFTEGPTADGQGNVYFTDIPNNRIHKIGLDGQVSLFAENTGGANGLKFAGGQLLYACQNSNRRIVTYDSTGQVHPVAEDVPSNDLVVLRSGSIYFTDPENHQVWNVTPGGERRVVAEGLGFPNGIAAWPDQGTLVVADTSGSSVWAFRIEADGSLAHKQPYYPLQLDHDRGASGADGLCFDTAGRLYVTTAAGLQMFDPTGRLSGVIAKPQPTWMANVCFGGPNHDALYATCTDKVYRRKIKARGVLYFQPPPSAK